MIDKIISELIHDVAVSLTKEARDKAPIQTGVIFHSHFSPSHKYPTNPDTIEAKSLFSSIDIFYIFPEIYHILT